MRGDGISITENNWFVERGEHRQNKTRKQSRQRQTKSKLTALEARRAVEDFLLMRHYQDLNRELYEF